MDASPQLTVADGRPTSRVMLALGLVVVALLTVAALVAVGAYPKAASNRFYEYDPEQIEGVDLAGPATDVGFAPSAGGSVEVRVRAIGPVWRLADAQVRVADGMLQLERSCGGLPIGGCSFEVDVAVPQGLSLPAG